MTRRTSLKPNGKQYTHNNTVLHRTAWLCEKVPVDFCNAFDTEDHGIPISILTHLRFTPAIVYSFSSSRTPISRKAIDPFRTRLWLADLAVGVPQRGILSPLIYSVFINFITSCIDRLDHLYTEDLEIYIKLNR